MSWATLALGFLLVAQQASWGPPANVDAPVSRSTDLGLPQPGAAEMVAEALRLPEGSPLAGRPLTVLAALSATADRRQQPQVVHAYWRLVEAVACYRVCFDHDGQVRQLRAEPSQAVWLRLARASTAAALAEAESAALAAQHELAALVALPAGSPLPVPADLPHAGPYHTYFQELFRARAMPAKAVLIDRTLPLWRRAIEERAAACRAAEQAAAACQSAHQRDPTRLRELLECLDESRRQRQALMASVCRYNDEIADYVFTVTPTGATAEALVGMLIRRGPAATAGAEGRLDPAVRPAVHEQPLPTPAGPTGKHEPTPATRPGQTRPPEDADPTLPRRPVVPVEPQPPQPDPVTTRKPTAAPAARIVPNLSAMAPESGQPLAAGADVVAGPPPLSPAMYPALVDAAPAMRAKQLTAALHWDRMLPPELGPPLSLEQCLGQVPPGERQAVIDAYWLARQRAAAYQVLSEQSQWLDELAASTATADAGGTSPRVQAARSAGAAMLAEAHVALLEAAFALAARIGRAAQAAWPVPSTAPYCGQYPLGRKTAGPAPADSWRLRRLEAVIPLLGQSVQQQATAVVEADAARAQSAAAYPARGESVEPVLQALRRQTTHTLSLLEALTRYNRSIAEYALTVLPPQTPGDRLAAMLVAQ